MVKPSLLVVTTSFPSSANTTAGIFVKRLNDSLGKYYQVEVLSPAGCSPEADEPGLTRFRYGPMAWQSLAQKPGGIPVALKHNPLLFLVVPFFLLCFFVAVVRRLRFANRLICHWSLSGFVAGFVNKAIYKKPSIVVFHGSDAVSSESGIVSRAFARWALQFNDHAVTVSQSMYNDMKEAFPQYADKIRFVSNGVSEPFWEVKDLEITRPIRFISICNLNPQKGVENIITAFAKITGMGADAHLTIVGDGPEFGNLQSKVAAYGLSDKVVFSGNLAPEQIPSALALAHCFISSSHKEGRPSVVLEAMAAGRCVILSDIPAHKELVENDVNGRLFPLGDSENLAVLMKEVCDHPKMLRCMAQKARDSIVNAGLTWGKTAEIYEELLK